MKNIKGPKSALTDFIEETGIQIKNTKKTTMNKLMPKPKNMNKKLKTIKYTKPIEMVNIKSAQLSLEEKEMESLLSNDNLYSLDFNDTKLKKFSIFLSKNRLMNQHYFQFLVEKSFSSLSIFDCSNISNNDYAIFKKLKKLELYQSGQLSEDKLNFILKNMIELSVLRLSGAFLVENIYLSKSLKVLDVTNCSRLKDDFIENLNGTFSFLEELRLSYCYGLTSKSMLKFTVKNLWICETRLSDEFLFDIENVKTLSIKRCPNINKLPKFNSIEYLDVEGITSLKTIILPDTIKVLNISYCGNLRLSYYPNIESLNVSNCHLDLEDIEQIYKYSSLSFLYISWNTIVDDKIFEKLVREMKLKKIEVFGCFSLSKKSVSLAYAIKDKCEVLGNPAETIFLINGED